MRRSGHLVPRFTRSLGKLSADALTIPPYEMCRLGYRMADRVIEYFERGDEGPAGLAGNPHDLAVALGGPVSQKPGDLLEVMQALAAIALPRQQDGDRARYFAQAPRPSPYPGVLDEWLGTGYQTIAASRVGGSGPPTVDLVVCEWLASLMALPDATGGVLLSGGSVLRLCTLNPRTTEDESGERCADWLLTSAWTRAATPNALMTDVATGRSAERSSRASNAADTDRPYLLVEL